MAHYATTKEQFAEQVKTATYWNDEDFKVFKLEDEKSALFQIKTKRLVSLNHLLSLGIAVHDPNINVSEDKNILVTFVIHNPELLP